MQTVICPYCSEINQLAEAEGATDGPREYHADCWFLASQQMSQEEIAEAWEHSTVKEEKQESKPITTNNERNTQSMLITGLDCLPGQEDLF